MSAGFRMLRDVFGLYSHRKIWDKKFSSGEFDHLGEGRNPMIVEKVESYGKGGKIVELGCGEGWLIFSVSVQCYSEYKGYDISELAISRARQGVEERNLNAVSFFTLDITAWPGDDEVNVILIEEVIYYLKKADQSILIKKAYDSLSDGGLLIITFHSRKKHHDSITNCLKCREGFELEKCGDAGVLSLVKRA